MGKIVLFIAVNLLFLNNFVDGSMLALCAAVQLVENTLRH
jgi:hypothetical protein